VTTTVTTSVVFTDLVGSTELSARLGPIEAQEVRSVHFGLLRDAVEATGGTEVKNLGDGLMVVYSSLGGALDGAVVMQQRIEQHNRKAAEPLRVRIGLSSGDVTTEDGDFFGEPVVEAARLCALADGGQIVTTEVVRLQARRTDHRFVPLGPLDLKGLPDPVEACAVSWEPAPTAAQVRLPGRLAFVPAAGVVGRVLERERLVATLKAAFAGDGHRVALLSGEPGIGKTTLATDLAQRAHDLGATVLYGRCDEDLGLPYQPFVEALGDLVASAPDAVVSAIAERSLSELSRLVPAVRNRIPTLPVPPSTDAQAERYLLFGAVTAVLTEVAAMAPVVLVLDDLHWADRPTVLLLRHLVSSLDRAEVLVVGTYRDSDLTATHPLTEGLATLRREAAVERIAVGGLDDDGVVAMFEGLAGHTIGRDGIALAHAMRRETDGNPFFTAELLRHLAEIGAIREDAGRWAATVALSDITLPESVREVVGQRVRRLSDDVQQLLTMASVIGREFDLTLLADLADRDEDDVLDAIEDAVAAQIVDEVVGCPGRFAFTHALVQRTLYEDPSASRRARIHRRIGDLLERDCGDDPGDRIVELAHHWMVATKPSEAAKAAGYAHRAGRRALEALAPDEAIRWFSQACTLLDADPDADPHLRLDVLIGLGDAQRQAGDQQYRETMLAAAADAGRLGDTDRLVAAALANQRGMVSNVGGVDTERILMLEQALGAVDGEDSQARARLLAAIAAELSSSGDLPRLRAVADEAESMARRLDDATLLRVLNLTFLPRWTPDELGRTLAASEEARALAARVDDPVARFWAALNGVYAMASSADRAGIDASLDQAVSLADEIGQPFLSWVATNVQCTHVLLTGDADEAERLAMTALQLGTESGQPDALVAFGTNLAGIRWHQGRVDELLPMLAGATVEGPDLPAFEAAYAGMLCECAELDHARTLFEAARRVDFHHETYDWIWLATTAMWADTAAWLGDAPAARVLLERLLPFEGQGISTGANFNGIVGMYLARLAVVLQQHDEALGFFARADARLRDLRAPFWRARNQLDWARLLVVGGTERDLVQAQALLTDARAAAATYGCRAVEHRAAELTRSLA
jgi:class 3 adenylate cyclase